MNAAVILAGGVGTRVGGPVTKQFIEVLGKPVLAYTLAGTQALLCLEFEDELRALAQRLEQKGCIEAGAAIKTR